MIRGRMILSPVVHPVSAYMAIGDLTAILQTEI